MATLMQAVEENVSFPKMEEKILKRWEETDAFKRSLKAREGSEAYIFYDGPPFATGLPHYGHLLAGTLKDIIPRYWTMKGKYVERRFGWDCHGLPVEYEIQQTLGLAGRTAIEQFGIANFNAKCREIVLRYTQEWKKTVLRTGRWVDFDNTYHTMDLTFMETIWWIFRQMHEKGLIYQGLKVVPYSAAIGTPLSNFEANQNYKEVQDPAITVSFPLSGDSTTAFLAWTTTPWTLISNLALTVGPDIDYVKVLDKPTGRHFILAEARLAAYYKKKEDCEILERFKGRDLEGWWYEPLFPYFATRREKGAFKVILGDFVTTEDGTGIVHTAPAFGEDDYFACQKAGIELVCPVDDEGKFTAEVPEYAGQFVKDADKAIIHRIKEMKRLIHQSTIQHSYPFCWRSDTPLIYKVISTWFVKVEAIKEALLAANAQTHWVPEHLRDGRFGNWLEGARDWAISRNRFWGTPLPIWRSQDGKEIVCLGSIKEMEELSGRTITDLHRESIDDITIPSREGRGELRRIPEVLDCWFESGSMPYAQVHYPFENKEAFESSFPADFIAEGLDQTRGWFYTLMVISTALFNKPAFKNVVVNGIILAEDGKKMSKRLKNYPDPNAVIDRHGADALRLFLIDSPAVRADDLRFSEAGVREIVRRVLLPWWNSYKFFVTYARIDNWRCNGTKAVGPVRPVGPVGPVGRVGRVGSAGDEALQSPNILDRWILSRLQSLIKRVNREMGQYHLYNVVTPLLGFIDELTNWYIRLNRRRFWGDDKADKEHAYRTLYTALYDLTRLMAPFTPFIAEEMFQNLRNAAKSEKSTPDNNDLDDYSVHFEDFPEGDENLIDEVLEDGVERMAQIILMGRHIRTVHKVKTKIPLDQLTIFHRRVEILEEIRPLERYIKEELNVKNVGYSTEEDDHIRLAAKPNFKTLGPRLAGKMGKMVKAFGGLHLSRILMLEMGATIDVEDVKITPEDVLIVRETLDDAGAGAATNRYITILMPPVVTEKNRREGLAREIIGRIQQMRKDAGFAVEDRIAVTYNGAPELCAIAGEFRAHIQEETLATRYAFGAVSGFFCARHEIEDMTLTVGIARA
ncbi:MAG: isoleucine--tRNA ligase [Candidatus Sumerlaeota bacterium]|nr:isoleucine--tRNA ligase [Candidatus Sumerlaeota bacterium]